MRAKGLLEQKGKSKSTYYIPGEELIALLPQKEVNDDDLSALPQGLSALPQDLSALPQEQQDILENIQKRIAALPPRINDKEVLMEFICELCSLCPIKLSELARLTNGTEKYIFCAPIVN